MAEAEFERDVRRTLRSLLYSGSGDAPRPEKGTNTSSGVGMVQRKGGFLDRMFDPAELPQWLTAADLEFYVQEFQRTGFAGGLNWYRAIDLGWELLAPFAGAKVTVPALYVAGDRDLVVAFPGMELLIPNLKMFVPKLSKTVMLPGCGHWTQQERAAEVNELMFEFLRTFDRNARSTSQSTSCAART